MKVEDITTTYIIFGTNLSGVKGGGGGGVTNTQHLPVISDCVKGGGGGDTHTQHGGKWFNLNSTRLLWDTQVFIFNCTCGVCKHHIISGYIVKEKYIFAVEHIPCHTAAQISISLTKIINIIQEEAPLYG